MRNLLLETTGSNMGRRPTLDESKLLPFAAWLMAHIQRRGYTVQRVADHADMHVSQLHKIIKSYHPVYRQYQRPGYEKTVLIGQLFGDVQGALVSAGYNPPEQEDCLTRSPIRTFALNAGYKGDALTMDEEDALGVLFRNSLDLVMKLKSDGASRLKN